MRGTSKLNFTWVDTLKGKVAGVSAVTYSSDKACEATAAGVASIKRR